MAAEEIGWGWQWITQIPITENWANMTDEIRYWEDEKLKQKTTEDYELR